MRKSVTFDSFILPKKDKKSKVSKTLQSNLSHKEENHGEEKASMLSPKWLNNAQGIVSQVKHHDASSQTHKAENHGEKNTSMVSVSPHTRES